MRSKNLSAKRCTVGYSWKYELSGGSLDPCKQFCIDARKTFFGIFPRNRDQKPLKKWKRKVIISDIKKVVFFLEKYAKFSKILNFWDFSAFFKPVLWLFVYFGSKLSFQQILPKMGQKSAKNSLIWEMS